ncbi:MAG TPA: hypothetical protein VL171_14420 [Verrucomicrobiae bacterium]|nr:hypothetical protein [Verrucomicrobiae bacterium]
MNNTNPSAVTMVVRLVDGSVKRFQIPAEKEGDELTLASRIERALQAQDLALELGVQLLVIPKHSILTVEVTPAPAKLPATAIRDGRIIGG